MSSFQLDVETHVLNYGFLTKTKVEDPAQKLE